VDREDRALPLTVPADLVSVGRASRYDRPRPPRPETVALYPRIDESYTATPFYGSRRLTAVWRLEGFPMNGKRVQHAMRVMGLRAVPRVRPRARPLPPLGSPRTDCGA
jgi:putative transposase